VSPPGGIGVDEGLVGEEGERAGRMSRCVDGGEEVRGQTDRAEAWGGRRGREVLEGYLRIFEYSCVWTAVRRCG
jgi:hypothetical protein